MATDRLMAEMARSRLSGVPKVYHPGLTPTRIEKYIYCEKQWAADELVQLPQPENLAADWGTGLHAAMEQYYKLGQHPPPTHEYHEPFKAMLRFAPPRHEYTQFVEQEFWHDGVPGTIDLCYVSDGKLYVWDWKSTGNLRYAKTEKQLLANSQFVIYGLAAMWAFDVNEAEMNWLYLQRKPNADGTHEVKPPVNVVVTRAQLEEIYLDRFKATVDAIKACGGDPDLTKYSPRDDQPKGCYRFNRFCHANVACLASERKKEMGTLEQSEIFKKFMAGGGTPPAVNPPDKPKPEPEAEVEAAPEPESKPEPTPPKKKAATKKKAPTKKVEQKGFELYLRAVPLGGVEHELLQDLLQPLCQKIAQEHDKPHWNLIPYAQGKAHLAALTQAVIDEGLWDGKVIVALGFGDEVAAVEDVLLRNALPGSAAGVR